MIHGYDVEEMEWAAADAKSGAFVMWWQQGQVQLPSRNKTDRAADVSPATTVEDWDCREANGRYAWRKGKFTVGVRESEGEQRQEEVRARGVHDSNGGPERDKVYATLRSSIVQSS